MLEKNDFNRLIFDEEIFVQNSRSQNKKIKLIENKAILKRRKKRIKRNESGSVSSTKTMSDTQFRDSQIPIKHEVLIDSNPEANQKIDFKSALMGNLSQKEKSKNILVIKLIQPFTEDMDTSDKMEKTI